MKIKIALAQLNSTPDPKLNLQITSDTLELAKNKGVDIVLFPELWAINYSDFPAEPELTTLWKERAIEKGDELFNEYVSLAKKADIAYTLNFLETNKTRTEFYNSSVLIDSEGVPVLHYRKTHTVDKGWERMLTAGVDIGVTELETDKGKVKVGTMICYDREFPEVARLLMLEGAEIVLTPNACTLENNRIAQFQARGFENMICVAMTNYPKPKNNGQSVAFDGMREKGANYDPTLIKLGTDEELGIFEIDIDKLREYRKNEIWGDAYRRPGLYKKLLEDNVQEPFIRKNARRSNP